MGFGFFKKKKKGEDAGDDADAPKVDKSTKEKGKKPKSAKVDNSPDPRKARKFFDYARTVTDARNYDYAIVCWINGLKHDPENMDAHEQLREVALRRMVAGGKAAGMKAKKNMPSGKTLALKMLAQEFLWAHEPLNASHAVATMEAAVKADLYEVAYWISTFALEANDNSKKPNKTIYVKIKNACSKMKAWDKAVEAHRRLVQMSPNNSDLIQELKQLEAEATVSQGGYGEESAGGVRRAIKDADKQRALEEQDAIAGSETQLDRNIDRARGELTVQPDNLDLLTKLVRALLAKQAEESEDEALDLLQEYYEKTENAQLKVMIGDIKMNRYKRKLRSLRKQYEGAHVEATKKRLLEQYQTLRQEQLDFELGEFEERVKNYPTKKDFRFYLGVRQFAKGDIDAAIGSFQEAKGDAKLKYMAMRYLGEAFYRKHLFDEAIGTFDEALESYSSRDDRLALELLYFKGLALEAKAHNTRSANIARESLKCFSKIAQIDYNFRDVKQRIESLRELVDKLSKK